MKKKRKLRPQNWRSPWRLVLALALRHTGQRYFDLDPAAEGANAKAKYYFDRSANGLRQPWCAAAVYCNPPWWRPGPWTKKAVSEVRAGRAVVVVMVLPYRPTAKWFLNLAWIGRRDVVITRDEIEGRIPFEAPPGVEKSTPREGAVVIVIRRRLVAGELGDRADTVPPIEPRPATVIAEAARLEEAA